MTIIAVSKLSPNVVRPALQLAESSIPLAFNLNGLDKQFSLTLNQSGGLANFGMVQCIYIDTQQMTSDVATSMTINFPLTNQNIVIFAGQQAYIPVLCPNPIQIMFTGSTNSFGIVNCQLLNFPVTPIIWRA